MFGLVDEIEDIADSETCRAKCEQISMFAIVGIITNQRKFVPRAIVATLRNIQFQRPIRADIAL